MLLIATTAILTSIAVFFVVILLLVSLLLTAKAKLAPSGPVKLDINGSEVEVESGSTLLSTLSKQNLFTVCLRCVYWVLADETLVDNQF